MYRNTGHKALLAMAVALIAICCLAMPSADAYAILDPTATEAGDTAGAYLVFDEEDAYQFAGFYVESFAGFENEAEGIDAAIIKAYTNTNDFDSFASELIGYLLSEDGIDAGIDAIVELDAGVAVMMAVEGADDSLEVVIKMSATFEAVAEGTAVTDDGTGRFVASVSIPVSLYSKISVTSMTNPYAFDSRIGSEGSDDWMMMPYAIDSRLVRGITVEGEMETGETPQFGYTRTVTDDLSASMTGPLTADEMIDLLEGTGSVLKDVYLMTVETTEEDGRTTAEGTVAELTLDLADLDLAGLLEEVRSAEEGEELDMLVNGLIDRFAPDIGHVDTVAIIPDVRQALQVLNFVMVYSVENGNSGFFLDRDGYVIGAEAEGEVLAMVSGVEEVSFGKEAVEDVMFEFSKREGSVSIGRCTDFTDGDEIYITVPSEICGWTVTSLGSESFRTSEGEKLFLTIPDTVTDVMPYTVTGDGDYLGPGSTIISKGEDGSCGLTFTTWVSEGKGYAKATGLWEADSSGAMDIVIPASVEFEGVVYEVVGIGGLDGTGFAGLSGLKSVEIRLDSTELYGTFEGCEGLERVTFESSTVILGKGAFAGCTNLKGLVFRDGVGVAVYAGAFTGSGIDPDAIEGRDGTYSLVELAGTVEDRSFPETYEGPGGSAERDGVVYTGCKAYGSYFYWAKATGEGTGVSVPASIDFDGRYKGNVFSLTIPDSDTIEEVSVGASVSVLNVGYLPNLRSFDIAEGNEYYWKTVSGGYTIVRSQSNAEYFYGSGEVLTLEEGMTAYTELSHVGAVELRVEGDVDSIGDLSPSIERVVFGKDVSYIPDVGANSVKEFVVDPDNPTYESIDGVLFGKDGTLVLYPSGKDGGLYEVPDGTTGISGGAFEGSALRTVVLNAGISKISPNAFRGCDNLRYVLMPEPNGTVFEDGDYVRSDSAIVWYNGHADVVILEACKQVSKYAFASNTPDILVIPEGKMSFNAGQDMVVVAADSTYMEGTEAHVVSYQTKDGAGYVFSTGGRALTLSASVGGMYRVSGILADGVLFSTGDTATFTEEDLRGISEISVATEPATHTVRFDAMGGSPVEAQTVHHRYSADDPGTPSRNGYGFTGWYADIGCTEEYDFSAPVCGDTTVYAGWERTDGSTWDLPVLGGLAVIAAMFAVLCIALSSRRY